MLVFLQVSFIVFLFFHFYLDLERIGVTKELFWPTTAMASFFFYKKKEALKSYKELIFYIASIYLILYSSINGMIYLPESFVIKQKMYLKFLYYTSFFSFLFLVHKQKTKRILFVFTLLSSTHIFLSWYYLINSTRSIPLLLYSFLFVSCFELPKKFKL
ncbi:MAG: hypothetical protein KDK45_17115, partial [Leptospiraceae bacterium]|nr:hypothetical protein [Leptospiraceae bacterium]